VLISEQLFVYTLRLSRLNCRLLSECK